MNTTAEFLHIDINSYFATMLQQENPKLRGRSIGVIKNEGRTCIIAASKEAKLLGVKTGMRLQEARTICPQLITIPAQFELYADATKRFLHCLEKFSPQIEVFSLDEAFLAYEPVRHLHPCPQKLGKEIQDAVKQTLGSWVSCNVGIGPSRFLAKMIGEISAKGSVEQITEQNIYAVLASTSFEDSCGIGPRLARRLAHIGVSTPLQLSMIDSSNLESLVGPFWSKELQRMAYGEDPAFLSQLSTGRQHIKTKSVSRSITLFQLENHPHEQLQTIQNLGQEVLFKLRQLKLAGRWLGLSLEGSHQQGHPSLWGKSPTHAQYASTHMISDAPIHHLDQLSRYLRNLFEQLQPEWPIIRFRVVMSLLVSENNIQPTLFDQWQKKEQIMQAIQTIQQKHGLYSITSARLLNATIINPEVTGYLGDKQFVLRNENLLSGT